MPARRIALLLSCTYLFGCAGDGAPDSGQSTTWRAAILSDTHVIAETYTCCENGDLDTTSIYSTKARLDYAIDEINGLNPVIEKVFITGDIFHENYVYGNEDPRAYVDNPSAAKVAKEYLDRFDADVEIAWGNHDYDLGHASREFTHQMFRAVFDKEPYYAVDHRGFRFLMLNSQLGSSFDATVTSADELGDQGSFGAEQLDWIAQQLDDGLPTFLFFHHHPIANTLMVDERDGELGDIFDVIQAYSDVVEGVFMGHLHRWIDEESLGLQDISGVQMYIMAGLRYDAGNYWVLELDEDSAEWSIPDRNRAVWGTTWSYDVDWSTSGTPIIDEHSDPDFDPATQSSDLDNPVDPDAPPDP